MAAFVTCFGVPVVANCGQRVVFCTTASFDWPVAVSGVACVFDMRPRYQMGVSTICRVVDALSGQYQQMVQQKPDSQLAKTGFAVTKGGKAGRGASQVVFLGPDAVPFLPASRLLALNCSFHQD